MMLTLRNNSRLLLTSLVVGYIFVQLIWQHLTSGVPKHYVLNDPSLPAISNWWGLIILPIFTWFLTTFLTKQYGDVYPRKVWLQLLGAGVYALVISILFYSGYVELLSMLVLPTIIMAALFLPIYQPPFLLGYVLVSSVGFGAVLPLIGGLVFAAIAYVVYNVIRPLPIYLLKLVSKSK